MRSNKIIMMLLCLLVLGFSGRAEAAEKSIGVVMSGDVQRYQDAHKAFVGALAKHGFDQNKVEIFVQTPNPDPMSWTNSVRKFVGVGVDVIVTYGAPAALAALKETSSIPVVFSYVYDPQSCGLKKGNSTGVSSKVPMTTLLKTLKSITPFAKIAVIYNPDEKDSVVQLDEIKKSASGLGFQVSEVAARSASEVKGKVPGAAKDSDCVYISCSAVVSREAVGIIGATNKAKTPAVTQVAGLAEKGALLALAPSSAEQGEAAAEQVAKILKGGSPSGMEVENAKRVDLVLNLKAANTLGLKVPFDVLNAATKVIK
ncbi:MAG: ABC transporter substrate-binding protein [Nitrospirae bacterium]|nr:ABC transporter substrate-binding protein [Nitrospirota bacterium]MBI5694176.1 ABC transporter substrate-binding protein [Nitrospirota bacterium]